MTDPPKGNNPYKKTDFPPRYVRYLAEILGGVGIAVAWIIYQPEFVSGIIVVVFGFVGNLYLHESIHYVVQSRLLGYEPIFDWPSAVWIPNVGLSVREGVISLMSPQILTVIYLILLPISSVDIVDLSVVVALILNLSGGMRDFAWTIRRLLWPKGHVVLVDSEGNEFVSFPE